MNRQREVYRQRERDDQRGQAVILVAAMLVAMIAVAGLAVDGGMLYLTHRRMQATADLAAMAGAQQLFTHSAGDAMAEATYVASANGEQAPESTVVVHTPPTSGQYQGNNLALEVQISRTEPTYFLKVLGVTTVPVSVRAVAKAGTDNPPFAVLALSKHANPGIGFGGGGDVITYGAGIMANSDVASAIKHQAGGSVLIDGPVNAVGGIAGVIETTPGNAITGGMPYFPDPFKDLGPPPYGGLTVRNGAPMSPDTVAVGGGDIMPASARADLLDGKTFGPGIYYGGIKITNGSYTFAPGIYILAGGGLQITGGEVEGDGVFFYNTVDGKGKSGPINITTTGRVWLKPPSTAPYTGGAPNMVFFQDRAVSGSSSAVNIEATGNTEIRGTVYVPTNQVKITGGGEHGVIQGQLIADTVYFGGGAGISVSYEENAMAHVPGSTLVE